MLRPSRSVRWSVHPARDHCVASGRRRERRTALKDADLYRDGQRNGTKGGRADQSRGLLPGAAWRPLGGSPHYRQTCLLAVLGQDHLCRRPCYRDGPGRLKIPVPPRQFSYIDSLTTGIPAFFLALWPNPRRRRAGLLKYAVVMMHYSPRTPSPPSGSSTSCRRRASPRTRFLPHAGHLAARHLASNDVEVGAWRAGHSATVVCSRSRPVRHFFDGAERGYEWLVTRTGLCGLLTYASSRASVCAFLED